MTPLKTIARPAVVMASLMAVSLSCPEAMASRQRVISSSE